MGLFDAPSRLVNRDYGDIYRQKADRLGEEGRQLFRLGRLEEAEEKVRQLIGVQSKVVGERHPDYASGLSLLAEILLARDELSDAETLLQRSLEIRKKSLGDQHPDYASSLDLLARLMLRWEDHVGAEPLLRKALEIRRSVLGLDHPDYASSLAMLAEVVGKSDEYDLAEPLFREAIETLTRVRGETHPEVADSCANLAQLLIRHGETTESESLLRHAIEIYRQAYGERHNSYVTTTTNLALLLHNRGDFQEAEPLWRLLLDMRRQSLGEKHPECAFIQIQLAQILQRHGDLAGAEALLREAAGIRKHSLGERHPEYATSLTHLASTLQRMGDLQGAEPLLRQALAIRKDVLGVKNPEYGTSLMNLALLVQKRGDITWAKMLLREAVDVRRAVCGENHPDYAHSLLCLGEIVGQQGEPTKAVAMIRRALEIRGETLGEYHPAYATNLCSLAAVLRKQGDFQEAEALLRRALQIRKEVIGEEHPDFMTNLGNLAWLLQRKGDIQSAERLLTHSLELRRRLQGVSHPDYLQNLDRLQQLQKDNQLQSPSLASIIHGAPATLDEDCAEDDQEREYDEESSDSEPIDSLEAAELDSYSKFNDHPHDLSDEPGHEEGYLSDGSTEHLVDRVGTHDFADHAIESLGEELPLDLEEEAVDFDRYDTALAFARSMDEEDGLGDDFDGRYPAETLESLADREETESQSENEVEAEEEERLALLGLDAIGLTEPSAPESVGSAFMTNSLFPGSEPLAERETEVEESEPIQGEWSESTDSEQYEIDSELAAGREWPTGDREQPTAYTDEEQELLDEVTGHDTETDLFESEHDAPRTSGGLVTRDGQDESPESLEFRLNDSADAESPEDFRFEQDDDHATTVDESAGQLEAARGESESIAWREAALENSLECPADDCDHETSAEGSFRPSPLRSDSMNQTSSDLSQELSDLSDRFSTLGEKLLAAARQLHAPGAPPSDELIETIGSCRRDFVEFRERTRGLARSLDVHSTQLDSMNSLQDVSNVLDAIAEVELHQSKNEEVRRRGMSVLDRVMAIQYSGGNEFAPLRECQDHARTLRQSLENANWKALPAEVERLTEGEHQFSHLLSLIEDHEDLGDDLWASHHESVSQHFGKPLAAAAARSKLTIPQNSGMALAGH